MDDEHVSKETEKLLEHVVVHDDKDQGHVRELCICPSCHTTPLVRAQVLTCGHNLCFTCYKRVDECPLCRKTPTLVGPNRSIRALSLTLKATCEFSCALTAEFATVEHVIHHLMNDCPRVAVRCPNTGCDQLFAMGQLQEHLATCGFALIRCPCGLELKRQETQDHLDTACPKVRVKCRTGCDAMIYRSEVFGHQTTCPRVMVHCGVPGCPAVVRRCDLMQHSVTSSELHARVASNMARRLQRQLVGDDWSGEIRPVSLAVVGKGMASFTWDLHKMKLKLARGQEVFRSPDLWAFEGRWEIVMMRERGAWLLSLHLLSRVEAILLRFKFVLPAPSHERGTESVYSPRQGAVFREGNAGGGYIRMSQSDLERYITEWQMGFSNTLHEDCLRIEVYMQEVDTA